MNGVSLTGGGGGGGAGAVVKAACLESGDRGFEPNSGVSNKRNVSSPLIVLIQYGGELPWPRGSVLGLKSLGLEFRIMSLEGSVISFISPSSWGYTAQFRAQFSLYVHKVVA